MPLRHRLRRREQTELGPADRYYILTGLLPHTHCCNEPSAIWPPRAQGWRCEMDTSIPPCVTQAVKVPWPLVLNDGEYVRALWEANREELMREAESYGFLPAVHEWESGRLTVGDPLEPSITAEWRRDFMRQYGALIQ